MKTVSLQVDTENILDTHFKATWQSKLPLRVENSIYSFNQACKIKINVQTVSTKKTIHVRLGVF
jgi:hypothetical protein